MAKMRLLRGVALHAKKVLSTVAVGLALSACAGRDPQPVASVQPQDVYADCTMIRAEIEANNAKMTELANEGGWKVTQTGWLCRASTLVRHGLERRG
jgi:hypothetical protein